MRPNPCWLDLCHLRVHFHPLRRTTGAFHRSHRPFSFRHDSALAGPMFVQHAARRSPSAGGFRFRRREAKPRRRQRRRSSVVRFLRNNDGRTAPRLSPDEKRGVLPLPCILASAFRRDARGRTARPPSRRGSGRSGAGRPPRTSPERRRTVRSRLGREAGRRTDRPPARTKTWILR